MIWVVGDIHNDYASFKQLINIIEERDKEYSLYLLGDIFDRSDYGDVAKPLELYFAILDLNERQKRICCLRGNHEKLLSEYINLFYGTPEKKRGKLGKYRYNTFGLLNSRLTEWDLLELANTISKWSIQEEVCVNGINYLLAHARTSNPEIQEQDEYYLSGGYNLETFFKEGVDGYISIVGHTPTKNGDVWVNEKKNVIMLDTGCGFRSGKLSCICIDTGEVYQV